MDEWTFGCPLDISVRPLDEWTFECPTDISVRPMDEWTFECLMYISVGPMDEWTSPGRNRNSKLLLGVTYRSEKILPTQIWLEEFENILANISAQWDGLLLITGDTNLDLMNLDSTLTKQYIDILNMNNLQQMVTKPTRVTATSQTLIDHFITSCPNRITHTDVLPCPLVSDHSAPYVCVNARVTRFLPRYKYIRNERNYNEVSFVEDVKNIPINIVYGVDDPDEKL